ALTRSLRRVGGVLRRSGMSALSSPTNEGIEDLRQATEAHPDGLLFYSLGIAQANKKRFPEAERAFRRAAESFSIVPIRRAALFALMYCRWELFDLEAEPIASVVASTAASSARAVGLKRQALESIHGLLRFGELRPDEADLASSVALAVDEIDLARGIVREWERGSGAGDLAPVRKRMIVEFRAGAYGAVLKATAIILGKSPADELARKYREESVKKLREQAERYRPPGRD
ncbi:MAG TPA: hypothetical protein VM533_21210, partial [Fimbriiglobus sp.]|nr:hypothetical protein [Fimbriiglobus sp.]